MNYSCLDRKTLSEKIRKQVYKKNNGLCFYCGCVPKKIQTDHFTPVSTGGSDEFSNLVPACHVCNRLKSDSDIEEFRERYVRIKILEYPTFSLVQKQWLISRGIDVDKEVFKIVSAFRFHFEKEPKE